MDTISKKLVQETINQLYYKRTTLIIAHRLSTVQRAFQIVVQDIGEVMEIGSHNELLWRKDGYYSRLCSTQFSDANEQEVVVPSQGEQLNRIQSFEQRSGKLY